VNADQERAIRERAADPVLRHLPNEAVQDREALLAELDRLRAECARPVITCLCGDVFTTHADMALHLAMIHDIDLCEEGDGR
jgi:hypothetical protein